MFWIDTMCIDLESSRELFLKIWAHGPCFLVLNLSVFSIFQCLAQQKEEKYLNNAAFLF